MAVCPNKSHQDWKTLEARYGEKGAFRMFIENGYELPVPENVSKRMKFDKDGVKFKSRDTLQALNDNPQLAKDIIDSLRELYPDVKVYEGGLFDKNGNWIDIAPGEKGMHYRNAFQGAVAWANDAYMETPPHEYAHEYIDMFRELPIVKKGIKQYGEEQLVKRMGAYYAKRKMSNSFQKFMQDFWASIKSFLGSPDVADVLSKHFYKGQMLDGAVHQGTAITRYQKGNKVFKPTNGGVNSNGQYDNISKKIPEISSEEAKNEIKANGIGDFFEPNFNEFDLYKLQNYIASRFNQLENRDLDRSGQYMNSPFLDKRLLKDVIALMKDEDALRRISQAIANQEVDLSKEETQALATILRAEKRLKHIKLTSDAFYDGKGNLIPAENVINDISNEVSETAQRRKALYDKIPNKHLRNFFKGAEKALASWQLNLRLAAKYLSGSEDSNLSDMAYKALDQADSKKLEIMFGFTDLFTGVDAIPGFSNWSLFNKQDSSIDELDTRCFQCT
jgi:hypothetical protein